MRTTVPLAFRVVLLGAALAAGPSALAAEGGEVPRVRPAVETDPQTGVKEWQWTGERLSVGLGQLLPDQVRAFFQGRGFEAPLAERVAQRCVFWGRLAHTGSRGAVTLDLGQWRTQGREGKVPLLLNRHWQRQWHREGVPSSPRTAFRWALFPTEHRFLPGDWLLGMIVFDHPPGADFDLELRWREGDQQRRRILTGLSCAADKQAEGS